MLCSLPLVRWEARMRKVMVAIVTLRKGNLKPCLFLTPRELILQFLDFLGSSGTWLMVCRRRRWHLYHVNIKRPMVTRLTDTSVQEFCCTNCGATFLETPPCVGRYCHSQCFHGRHAGLRRRHCRTELSPVCQLEVVKNGIVTF
jgi:hypothetical protein